MSTDALIMLRRNFKHTARNPVTVFNAVLLPIVIGAWLDYALLARRATRFLAEFGEYLREKELIAMGVGKKEKTSE